MIIYQNGLITLDYNPSTDILNVDLPNVAEFGVSELTRSLEIVADSIKNYHIKKLLLDSSNVLVEQIQDEDYKVVVEQFIQNLSRTRLEKLARVNSNVLTYEERVIQVSTEAVIKLNSPIMVNTFGSKANALNWLQG